MFLPAQHTAGICLLIIANLGTLQAQQTTPSTDLATMIGLVDDDKLSSLAETKQLRERNSQHRQFAPLFDFSYSLTLVKGSRWKDAIEILQPFADARPQVHQARMLLIRCYIELDKFDNVAVETAKLLDKLPNEDRSAEEVAKKVGLIVGYLNFARSDCPDEIKRDLEENARAKIPDALQVKFEESISLVESKVASLKEEIAKAEEKAESNSETKIADNLGEAERLRAEAEAKAAELQSREKDRSEKFEKVKLDLQKMELEYGKLAARQNLLDNQINGMRRNMMLLERTVTTKDSKGNQTTTTEISDRPMYARLERMIGMSMVEMQTVDANARVLLNSYQQLQTQARGLADQKQLDELFTKSKMNQLSSEAQSKQKRAEREADRKGKKTPSVARGLQLRMKNYSTYDELDVAANKEYLLGISKRFLPQ